LSLKAVHSWVEKFSQERSKVADDTWLGPELTETTVERLLCSWFPRAGKARGQVYLSWWRICREINDFLGPNITCFTFYIHLWPIYWLSLVAYE
jgi:hypothetical protein